MEGALTVRIRQRTAASPTEEANPNAVRRFVCLAMRGSHKEMGRFFFLRVRASRLDEPCQICEALRIANVKEGV
jgi:hypothetical protein